jgi:hypothetical protein
MGPLIRLLLFCRWPPPVWAAALDRQFGNNTRKNERNKNKIGVNGLMI